MAKGTWKPITEPPKKDGKYLVHFYFKHRHPTDRMEVVYRNFVDGVCLRPYHVYAGEGSELLEWFDESQEED